jgi:hypothetical protein
VDDDTKSHVCEESEDCRPHTYARVSYEAECRIPPFVNLIQTIGGRREVRKFYEIPKYYEDSDIEEQFDAAEVF